jgi:hypothetical protein
MNQANQLQIFYFRSKKVDRKLNLDNYKCATLWGMPKRMDKI